MAGKKKVEKEGGSWIGEVEKYSRQIWLAGLGAYSKISNDGNKLFDTLVKDGEKAEKQAKTGIDKQVDVVKSSTKTAKSRVGDVRDLALGKWGELEEALDKRLNSAISRLGVPSRLEVKALHSKVDTLTKQIEKLTGVSVKPAAKPAVKAKAPAKPAVKAPVKAAVKAASKPVAKAASKVVAKPAVKPVAKAVAKPVAAAKPVVAKPTAAKPVAAKKPVVKKAPAPKTASAAAPAASAPAATPSPAAPASTPSTAS